MAVAAGASGTASAKTVVASGKSGHVYVLKGQTLRLDLSAASNGSTGYHWQQRGKRDRDLRRLSQHTTSDGKFQVFSYRARRAGSASLHFSYLPPAGSGGASRRYTLGVSLNNRWRAPGCRPKGSHTVVENSQARVFTLKRKVYSELNSKRPIAFTGHFGCVFGGKAFGFDGAGSNDPEYWFPVSRYFLPTLRGTLFGHAYFYAGTVIRAADDGYYVARTIDLENHKVIRAAYPDQGGPGQNNTIEDLVMSDSGGLAWTENSREGILVARSDQPPAQTDGFADDRTLIDDGQSGAVDPKSLTLDGPDVTWLRAGQLQRAPLR